MTCKQCNAEIPAERLEVYPNAVYCVKCIAEQPTQSRQIDIAQASSSARNGFAKSD